MGYTQIRLRHDPAHLWTSANPVLALGEAGFETDTKKLKVGDGAAAWNDLPYTGGTGAGGPVSWGDLTGLLSGSQALTQALNGKQNTSEKGQANGYAPLDAGGRLPEALLPEASYEMAENKGAPNGYAGLGQDCVIPDENLPVNLERTANKGTPGGYAGLGSDGKLLDTSIPTVLERTANRGIPDGYAPLGNDGKVPAQHLPPMSGGPSGDGEGVPRGVIVMWSGALADVPAGWALCDGTNGTPNLLDRFICSVPDAESNPGGAGGKHMLQLTVAQMPAHGHVGNPHKHPMGHNHNMDHIHILDITVKSQDVWSGGDVAGFSSDAYVVGGYAQRSASGPLNMMMIAGLGAYTVGDFSQLLHWKGNGAHWHGLSWKNPSYSGNTGNASYSLTGDEAASTQNTGNNATFDNRPAYFTLAFIMKL